MSNYPEVNSEQKGEQHAITIRRKQYLFTRFGLYDEEIQPVIDHLIELQKDGKTPPEITSDHSEHHLVLGKRWGNLAKENIKTWGNQRHDILLLALIEEIGEIAMAMESHCNTGDGLPPNAVPHDQPEVIGRELINEMAALGRKTRTYLETEFPEPSREGTTEMPNIQVTGEPQKIDPIIEEVEDAAPLLYQLYLALNEANYDK